MVNEKGRKVLEILVGIMIFIKLFDLIFNPNKVFPGRVAVFSSLEMLVVLILGVIGLYLYEKIKLPRFLNSDIKKLRVILSLIGLGIGVGVVFVIYDFFVRIGDMSVGWPLSVLFYVWGAIVSEVVLRLFLITFLVWLFSNVLLKGKYRDEFYWIFATILALFVSINMIMMFFNPLIPLIKPATSALVLLGMLVLFSELLAFRLLQRYGFLSNLIFRMSFYLVWHIVWPVLIY